MRMAITDGTRVRFYHLGHAVTGTVERIVPSVTDDPAIARISADHQATEPFSHIQQGEIFYVDVTQLEVI